MAASLFFKHKRLLLILPRQEGKTELGVRLLHDITSRPFTSSSLFLAKDHSSAKKATREKFMRIFEKEKFVVNTESVYLRKHPTSAIFMSSVDKDPDRNRGGTYSMIHWTEVAFSKIEKSESIISVYDKVIQPTMRKTDGYVFLESTNNGRNGWKDLWDGYRDFGFSRLRVALSDMVYLGLISAEEYEKVKSTTHPDVFRQEFEGEWVSFQGKTYNEFDHSRHIEEIPPPEEWQRVIAAIDWGYSPSATAILYAYVRDEIVYIFDEHYELKELAQHTAEKIEVKKSGWKINRLSLVADHEEDRIEELRRRGITCGKANKTNVMGARIQIKELLYFDKIKIHPRCKMLIRDLDAAAWHPKKEGELDEGACTWGHWDAEAALRYLVRELSEIEVDEPIKNPMKDSISEREWEIRHGAHEG